MSEHLTDDTEQPIPDDESARKAPSEAPPPPDDRVSTGLKGLDEILHGGLIPGRGYLVRGDPGTGKTILGLHFLREGLDRGEEVLLITLEESADDLRENAASLHMDIDPVPTLDLSPAGAEFGGGSYDVFSPDEVEADDVTQGIRDRVEEADPDRVFVDPITVLRYLTPDEYRFRKQVLGMSRHLKERDATLLMTSQPASSDVDPDLQFITDGTITFGYRGPYRTISVPKFRGSPTRSGDHSVRIGDHGITVFPALHIPKSPSDLGSETVSSGIPALDELLHGGIERSTTTVISGPTGAGKTTLGAQFMKEAAGRGERSVVYLFEEAADTFLSRSQAINIPVQEMIERGTLGIETIQALERSLEEVGQMVREDVEEDGARLVMLDGLAGMRMATRGDIPELQRKVHALAHYLQAQDVTTILIDEVREVQAGFQATNENISYLADNIIFLRHIELEGELRKVLGVLKKRVSDFERHLRELEITEHGIKVGAPLTGLRGILSGAPEMVGRQDDGVETP